MDIINQRTELVPIDSLHPHPRNPHQGDVGAIAASIDQNGFYGSLVVQAGTNTILAGHHKWMAARHAGAEDIPVTFVDVDDETALRILLADNRIQRLATDDSNALGGLLQELAATPAALAGTGFDGDALDELLADLSEGGALLDGAGRLERAPSVSLTDRFIVPPFSVLDARQGYWQERKRAWLALGIQSELGRGEATTPGSAGDTRHGRDGGDYDGGHAWLSGQRVSPGSSPQHAASPGADGKTVRGDSRGHPIDNANGLLGESEQARSHYGGNGKHLTWVVGDRPVEELDETSRKYLAAGRQTKSPARSNGQDLMRREHTVGLSHTPRSEEVKGQAIQGARPPHGPTVTQAADGSLAYRPTNAGDGTQSGTSIFDPVLCELAYRWFCPAGGTVLDPFAGGSVRGIVASRLGRQYVGIDLRPEQIAANEEQAQAILACEEPRPRWIVGDSRDLATLCADAPADLVFTCPPYYDLEVYSSDPADLSNAGDYARFLADYRAIIQQAVARLSDDRFACIVVGDIRDQGGFYRNFVSDTIAVFEDAGARLYNEAILVTAVGSLPIRVGRQFSGARKLGKTHQNCLAFVKGDPKRAVEACGPVEVDVPQEQPEHSPELSAIAVWPGG